MTIVERIVFEVSCDYSQHSDDDGTLLKNNALFHRIDNTFVICEDCWENVMTVEGLLTALRLSHRVQSVKDI